MKNKFNKMVVLEPIVMTESGMKELENFCDELIIYDTVTNDEEECIKRIGDAECILVSVKSKITRKIIETSPNLKFINMGCSLYDEKYSNVDIKAAKDNNIEVLPLKDYGDEGTIEYIIAELLNLLHGLKGNRWKEKVQELNSIKVGIIGLGTIGGMTAKALKYFGADVYYYSRTRKELFEKGDIKYLDLKELLETVDAIILCVNRDVLIMDKEDFEKFGSNKIFINIALGTCYDIPALDNWLENKSNYYICDNASINEKTKHILDNKNVIYNNLHAGHSSQTDMRATNQTLNNIKKFLNIGGNNE